MSSFRGLLSSSFNLLVGIISRANICTRMRWKISFLCIPIAREILILLPRNYVSVERERGGGNEVSPNIAPWSWRKTGESEKLNYCGLRVYLLCRRMLKKNEKDAGVECIIHESNLYFAERQCQKENGRRRRRMKLLLFVWRLSGFCRRDNKRVAEEDRDVGSKWHL